jgi:hypothetical protein
MVGTILMAMLLVGVFLILIGPDRTSGILAIAGLVLVGIVGMFGYFLPMIIAILRDHHQIGPIIIVNIFLGWTYVGWVVALAMSVSAVNRRVAAGR